MREGSGLPSGRQSPSAMPSCGGFAGRPDPGPNLAACGSRAGTAASTARGSVGVDVGAAPDVPLAWSITARDASVLERHRRLLANRRPSHSSSSSKLPAVLEQRFSAPIPSPRMMSGSDNVLRTPCSTAARLNLRHCWSSSVESIRSTSRWRKASRQGPIPVRFWTSSISAAACRHERPASAGRRREAVRSTPSTNRTHRASGPRCCRPT